MIWYLNIFRGWGKFWHLVNVIGEVFNKLNLQSIITIIPFLAPTKAQGFKMLYLHVRACVRDIIQRRRTLRDTVRILRVWLNVLRVEGLLSLVQWRTDRSNTILDSHATSSCPKSRGKMLCLLHKWRGFDSRARHLWQASLGKSCTGGLTL